MQRRRVLATVLGVLAGASLLAHVRLRRAEVWSVPDGSAPLPADRVVAVPDDWATYPVFARLDLARRTPRRVLEESIISDRHIATAPLGDAFAQFQYDTCIGGSSCTFATPNLHHLRVGALDPSGDPTIATSLECVGTVRVWTPDPPPTRSCNPESLTLRRVTRGEITTSVVTFRDPDDAEKAVVAFTRISLAQAQTERVRLLRSARTGDRIFLAVSAAALFVAGIAALVSSTRLGRAHTAATIALLLFSASIAASLLQLVAYP
ncbi:MAG TPA: hypothetical protein VLT33_02375 [Labilithrix sp.]|nr:hypothetical protein [Labilithrix sp.]